MLKMRYYYLLKYSPYEECRTVAYSAGNRGGQSPSEAFITETQTLTARVTLIKRQNPNWTQSIFG